MSKTEKQLMIAVYPNSETEKEAIKQAASQGRQSMSAYLLSLADRDITSRLAAINASTNTITGQQNLER